MNDASDPQWHSQDAAGPSKPVGGPSEPSSPPASVDAPDPSMADIDREVAQAMSGMDPNDLRELRGEGPSRKASSPGESVEPGAELSGTVVEVSDDEVYLEFGPKSQGVVPRSQFGKKEKLERGRKIDVVVECFDESTCLLKVNRKGAMLRATWTNLSVGMEVEGKVIGVIKGGLEVDLKGIRAFMPGSQVDRAPMRDISDLLNQIVRCEVIELDRRHKNVLLSRRKVLDRESAAQREKLKAELAVGQSRKGIVKTIMDYGAFVDLGGIDGLVHIRDLSWGSVDKVTDVLSVGQEIDVQVLKIDAARDRISLGLKHCQPDPWIGVADSYPAGTALKIRIVRLADFGAFAELEPGVEGLIPISEMSWTHIRKTSDVVSVGDMVDACVIRLEVEKRRLALSLKQVQQDPWEGILESFPINSLVRGKITRLADFGAFVELVPGVEGLIHISELAQGHVKSCKDVVEAGQEVEVRVLGVETEKRRIALSIKAVNAPVEAPAEAATQDAPIKPKQRKQPRRGGLSSHYDW